MSTETDFNKVAQTVAQNVQQISNNGNVVVVVDWNEQSNWNCFFIIVNQMQRMVNQLGTTQDNENLRNQL